MIQIAASSVANLVTLQENVPTRIQEVCYLIAFLGNFNVKKLGLFTFTSNLINC